MSNQMDLKEKNIAVLLGGFSAEAEVSEQTGKAIHQALTNKGYKAIELPFTRELHADLKKHNIDIVFNALHGTYGEDGVVQGVLELAGIPYTGSGVRSSALAMDKILSKRLFESISLPSLPWKECQKGEQIPVWEQLWSTGVVVKPNRNGSSVGVTICQTEEQYEKAMQEAFRWDDSVLLEKYVQGRELTVGILEGRVLGVLELKPAVEFYDYSAKYERGDTQYLCPAPLSEEMTSILGKQASQAYHILGCQGYARVDFMLEAPDTPWILEVNTLPGMTSSSLLPKIAAQAGFSFEDLCEAILETALVKISKGVAPQKNTGV